MMTRAWWVLLLAVALAGGCARKRKAPPPPQPKAPVDPTVIEFKGIHWQVPDAQNRPMWDLKAERGGGTPTQGTGELENVECRIYSEGTLAMEARAPRVQADYTSKRLLMLGGVTARTVNGKRGFRSNQIALQAKDGRRAVIEAQGGVRLDVDGIEITGERLLTNPRLDDVQVSGG